MRTTFLTTRALCLMPHPVTCNVRHKPVRWHLNRNNRLSFSTSVCCHLHFNRPAGVAYRHLHQFVSSLLRLPPILRPYPLRRHILNNTVYSSEKVSNVFPAVCTSTHTRASREEVPTKIIGVLATARGIMTKQEYPWKRSLSSTLRAVNRSIHGKSLLAAH
jgi:hypothetical protein